MDVGQQGGLIILTSTFMVRRLSPWLDALTVFCPGHANHPLDEKIHVRGLNDFLSDISHGDGLSG